MTSPETAVAPALVQRWLIDHGCRVEAPLRATLIPGGRSNLTYLLEDAAGQRWVLRRPPLGELLPSAHDMSREHRILSALRGTPVPVPPLVGFDDETADAPFYVMAYVEGRVVRSRHDAQQLEPAARRRAADALADTLADLHAIDADSVGLGELGRKADYAARQLRRWHRQWEQQQTAPLPLIDELHAEMEQRIPAQQGHAIVHGDYKLDNVIVAEDGEIAAVLDWELCTLGDPLADLATMLVYSTVPPGGHIPIMPDNILADGFPDGRDYVERYAAKSARNISDLGFHLALAYWKLAVIYEGVLQRSHAGAYGGSSPDEDQALRQGVERLAEAARDALANPQEV